MLDKKITIAIATFNRSSFLKKTVENVILQNHPSVLEIIIVDQSTDNKVRDELKSYFKNINFNISYLTQDKPAVCVARNTIISKSKGDIILFFDDDVILGKDCIESHLSVYKNNNVKSCIGHIYHRKFSCEIDLLDIDNPRIGTDAIMDIDAKLDLDYKGSSISCNQSFDRNVLSELHGFDENFVGGYYEDADLGLRLKKLGYKIAFHPNAMVLHLRAPNGGLRFEKTQPFSEFDRIKSFVLFYVRYKNDKQNKMSLLTVLRAGPFRRANVINPYKHITSWYCLIKAFRFSLKEINMIKSILK